MNAATWLVKFVEYAAPLVPEIRRIACAFFRCHQADLGPVPPDLRADFAAVDAEIDAKMRKPNNEKG